MRSQENKRKTARLHHEIPVAYRSVGSFLTDWATNLSQGGLFINTRNPLPVGTAVRVIIQLPGASFPYDLAGRVARVTDFGNGANLVPGMAVEFQDLDDGRRRELEGFVERLRGALEDA
jgi:type IV pilus assembly protein PilZ